MIEEVMAFESDLYAQAKDMQKVQTECRCVNYKKQIKENSKLWEEQVLVSFVCILLNSFKTSSNQLHIKNKRISDLESKNFKQRIEINRLRIERGIISDEDETEGKSDNAE